jgi:hypothetical protein
VTVDDHTPLGVLETVLVSEGLTAGTIPLDPWTVFGDAVLAGDGGALPTIDVPDIGVLPPAGRYLGTVACEGVAPRAAWFRVPARINGKHLGGCRRIAVELSGKQNTPYRSPVAMVFEAVVL